MPLVKKCNFFHYFVWAKIRLETRFNNVLDKKETFYACKKNRIFPKGGYGEKMLLFLSFVFA